MIFFILEIKYLGTFNVKYSVMLLIGGIYLKNNYKEKHYYEPHYSNIMKKENVFSSLIKLSAVVINESSR